MKSFNQNTLLKKWYAILIAMLLMASMPLQAATKEEAVKAGSTYNFTKFTLWPNEVGGHKSFNLCVFGGDKLGGSLDELSGKLVLNKSIIVKHHVDKHVLSSRHMAFIAHDDHVKVTKILSKVASMPILTVSDSPSFVDNGGMVGFVKEGAHVGFEINVNSVELVGIHIGAQLLKLAKKVKGIRIL